MNHSLLACLHSLHSRLQTLEARGHEPTRHEPTRYEPTRYEPTRHELEMANGNAAARELVDVAQIHPHQSPGRRKAMADSAARLAGALPGLDQETFDMELRQAVSDLPPLAKSQALSFAYGALSQAHSRLAARWDNQRPSI